MYDLPLLPQTPRSCTFVRPGSAWSEYQKSGTVHGLPLPAGLKESEKLPTPLFTPSTKADQGEHDENISPDQGILLSHTRSEPSRRRRLTPAHISSRQTRRTGSLRQDLGRRDPAVHRGRPLRALPRAHPRRHEVRVRTRPFADRRPGRTHPHRRGPHARLFPLLARLWLRAGRSTA